MSGHELSRQELVRRTHLGTATVFRIADALQEEKLVVDAAIIEKKERGRKAMSIAINRQYSLACGIDLGGTNCRIVIADLAGTPLQISYQPTPVHLDAVGLATWVVEQVRALVAATGTGSPLGAAAIGLPGVVAADYRTVVASENLNQIIGTAFTDELIKQIAVPVKIGNDSNISLLGEMQYGRARGARNVVMFTLGTGLGTGVSVNGSVISGQSGLVGEFGRLRLPASGLRMRQLLSGAGLAQYARSRGVPVTSAADVFLADTEEKAAIVAEVHSAARHLVSLAALAYEPELILFAGGFSDAFGDELISEFGETLAADLGVHTEIRRSALTKIVGILGSLTAALALLRTELGVSAEDAASLPSDKELIARTCQQLLFEGERT
jgi:predicted NBD/HSP70 family sugar kinase